MKTNGRQTAVCILALTAVTLTYPSNAQEAKRDTSESNPGSIQYAQATIGTVPVKVLTVDLSDSDIKVTGMMARGGAGHSESWSSMINRGRPTVAITGTFFCTESLLPVGDLVIDGKLAHFGGTGAAICVTPENDALLRMPQRYRHIDWRPFDFVLRSGPTLVRHGEVYVNPRTEGFRDPSVLRPTGRLAVGITGKGKLILAATRKAVTLSQMAWVMRGLGSEDAVNLDAGGSLGLYYGGKTIIQPRRKLTNLLLVYADAARYQEVKNQLTTPRVSASAN